MDDVEFTLSEDDERVGFELTEEGGMVVLRRWGEKRAVWPRFG